MRKAAKKKPARRTPVLQCSKAYKEAVEEIRQEHVDEIKMMVVQTLRAISDKEAALKRGQEELAFLRKDLDDLKRGRLDAIKKRHDAATLDAGQRNQKPASVSPIDPRRLSELCDAVNLVQSSGNSLWSSPATGAVTVTTSDATRLPGNTAFVSSIVANAIHESEELKRDGAY